MPPKRKRESSPTTSSKKAKTLGKSRGRPRKSRPSDLDTLGTVIQHPHGEVDTEQLYKVRRILDEDAKRYHIDWEDGPDGEQYEPTWEPKENANDLAIADWKQAKAERKRQAQEREREQKPGTSRTSAPDIQTPEPASKKRGRPRKLSTPESPVERPRKGRGRPRKQSAQHLDLRAAEPGTVKSSPERRAIPQTGQESDYQGYEGRYSPPRVSPQGSILEIQDSCPQQRDNGAGQLARDLGAETDKLHVSHSSPRPPAKSPEVRISPPAELHEASEDESTFPSSQVLSGTQPQKSPSPELSQPVLDAAIAPNLTQKHSQYLPEESSTSEEGTSSVVITSSSSVHTFATPHQFPVGAIIPDSQSINDSLSYIPSQNISGQSVQTTQSQYQDHSALLTQQLSRSDNQTVPESSVPQGTQLPDVVHVYHNHATKSAELDDFSAYINDPSSPVEAVVVQAHAPDSVASRASPVAARTSSSTSSPPPAESPDKIQSQSQLLSQSQPQPQSDPYIEFQLQPLPLPQSQPHSSQQLRSDRPGSIEQAAQRPETTEFDTTASIAVDEAELVATDRGCIGTEQVAVASATLALPAPDNPLSQQDSASLVHPTSQVVQEAEQPISHSVEQGHAPACGLGSRSLATHIESTFPDNPQHQEAVRSVGFGVVNSSLPISSPFPPAPSQDVGPIGESAPPVPGSLDSLARTPTRDTRASSMETPSSVSKIRGKMSVKERLVAARAARSAKSGVTSTPRSSAPVSPKPASAVPARLQSPSLQDREARSPSMIPATEAPTKETPEEYFRSERYETLLPGDDLDIQTSFEPLETAPKTVNLHSIRYVPINFGEQQRDHYKQTVTYRRKLIDEFTSKVWAADSPIADKARSMFQELRNIVLHPDLINEESYTQPSQVDPEFKAQWDVDSSTKFRFLKHYLQAAHDYNLHTVLLVKPGRIVPMLQTFFQGNNVDFQIAPNVVGGHKPAITILAPGYEAVGIHTPDLILSMQGDIPDTYTAEIQKLLQADTAIPAVSLVVPRTVEHIEKTIRDDVSEAERLHILMGTITTHRSEAGRERDSTNTAEIAASRLVNFVLSPLDWPFGDLPEIRLIEPVSPSQASTESRSEELADGSSNDGNSHGLKRALDNGEEVQPDSKKARFQLSAETAVNDSHVSDSVASQQAAAIKALKDEFALRESEMTAALRKSQTQLDEHIRALEMLQYQHEDQRQQLIQAESERDRITEATSVATMRITTLQGSVTDLRTERSDLQNQLREAKEAILDHSVPERAQFEALKEAAAVATAERTKLLGKVKSAEDQLDYIRDQYQTASNQAVTLGKANTVLEAQVTELGRKAAGEQSRVREMFLGTHSKNLVSRNKQLESMLRSREELLQRKEEEIARLKETGRGRMNTRQSSVPRTPRIGSPLAQGTASRQGSPAAGKGPHPLRNAR